MTDDHQDLELAIRAMEEHCNKQMAQIIPRHGINGALTALVNLGTGFVAKALVMIPPENRDTVLMTIQMLIDSRTEEGIAAVESSMAITKAMGSTCRPH